MKIMFAVFASVLLLSSCGGRGDNTNPPPTSHTVHISWAENRETAVNSAGGGYIVAINGQAPIDFRIVAMNLDQKQPGFPVDVLPNYLKALGVK